MVAVTICSYTLSTIPTKHFQSFAGSRMLRGTVWVTGDRVGFWGCGRAGYSGCGAGCPTTL